MQRCEMRASFNLVPLIMFRCFLRIIYYMNKVNSDIRLHASVGVTLIGINAEKPNDVLSIFLRPLLSPVIYSTYSPGHNGRD